MSNRHKEELLMAARRAATEAASSERARCLWILNRLVQKCSEDIDSKVLPASQLQLVKLRFELTKTVVKAATTLIVSGVRPPADPPPSEIIKP